MRRRARKTKPVCQRPREWARGNFENRKSPKVFLALPHFKRRTKSEGGTDTLEQGTLRWNCPSRALNHHQFFSFLSRAEELLCKTLSLAISDWGDGSVDTQGLTFFHLTRDSTHNNLLNSDLLAQSKRNVMMLSSKINAYFVRSAMSAVSAY